MHASLARFSTIAQTVVRLPEPQFVGSPGILGAPRTTAPDDPVDAEAWSEALIFFGKGGMEIGQDIALRNEKEVRR